MTLALLWIQLGAASVIVLAASQFLARSANAVGQKTGLGRSFVGVLMLATATSLPEMGTGVSSIALLDEPDLAIGDAFGSNLFNLMIIGLADLYWRKGPVLTSVKTTSVVIAASGAGLIALATAAIYIHGATSATSGWYLSPVSIILALGFVGAMLLVYRLEGRDKEPNDAEEGAGEKGRSQGLGRALGIYIGSAVVVVASSVWLARTGDQIAETMDWEASFIGTQFLAMSTSLPEVGTSFAALRLNAPDLAIANLLGSNVFNMGCVLFVDDLVYTRGTVWAGVSDVHLLSGLLAVVMTTIVIGSVLLRPRSRPGRLWTVEGGMLLATYIAASALVFTLA